MTTSGTNSYNPDFTDLAEQAWMRVGQELRSGFQLKTARWAMNNLTIEWSSRGINLWTLEQGTLPLVAGQASYALPADTVDIIEHSIRTGTGLNQTDLNIARISVSTYASIPNKNTPGRPIQIYVERARDNPVVTLWQVPDTNEYTLVYRRMRRLQDAGNGPNTADVPFRFIPCLVAGLAYQIGLMTPESAQLLPILQAEYERQWDIAAGEDRDRASVRMVPRILRAF